MSEKAAFLFFWIVLLDIFHSSRLLSVIYSQQLLLYSTVSTTYLSTTNSNVVSRTEAARGWSPVCGQIDSFTCNFHPVLEADMHFDVWLKHIYNYNNSITINFIQSAWRPYSSSKRCCKTATTHLVFANSKVIYMFICIWSREVRSITSGHSGCTWSLILIPGVNWCTQSRTKWCMLMNRPLGSIGQVLDSLHQESQEKGDINAEVCKSGEVEVFQ